MGWEHSSVNAALVWHAHGSKFNPQYLGKGEHVWRGDRGKGKKEEKMSRRDGPVSKMFALQA